ncbi:hypothetical protein IWW37_001607 [Coemansia sp. RSA 2050]|nr:hypothetical protein IWW37_001607 [Coemansia sp. RSA 2050]
MKLPLLIPPDHDFWKRIHDARQNRDSADVTGNVPATTEPTPKPKPSSWAALLKPVNGTGGSPASKSGPMSGSRTNGHFDTFYDNCSAGKQPTFKSLEDALESWQLNFSAPPVQPRGLVNTGNMCFMNVVLQALLYCAPFYNLLWSVKAGVAFSFKATTPLLEALIQYVHEFKHDRTPLAHMLTDLVEPFVPENVYEALRKKNVFQTLRGQQEDAQEFMSYLVDGINEEMSTILSAHQPSTIVSPGASDNSSWLEVGQHNKVMSIRDSGVAATRTPITRIFGGLLQSTLDVPYTTSGGSAFGLKGKAPPSSNREAFQWLALDVSSNNVETIEDAFDEFVAPETIEGYMNVLGESVTATKQILLERVPPVLVLHLKRFVFCPNEGVQKVHKFIEYPATLSLSAKWFAKTAEAARHRNSKYRLSGVIYHHGSQASGGHYTCDLLRSANEWLRFDDVDIGRLNSIDDALAEKKDRTAYILFYTICH